MRKQRLIAGTINHWPDDMEWQNWHLDITARGCWNRELSMAVGPDWVADVSSPGDMAIFRDEMFDEVRMHHVLEHMRRERGVQALHNVKRILRSGGALDLEVPNVAGVAEAFVAGEIDHDGLQQWLYGEDLNDVADAHQWGYTDDDLRSVLHTAGFAVQEISVGLAIRVWATA